MKCTEYSHGMTAYLKADACKSTRLLGVEVATLALCLLAGLVFLVSTTVSRCPGQVSCLLALEVQAASLAVQEQHHLQEEAQLGSGWVSRCQDEEQRSAGYICIDSKHPCDIIVAGWLAIGYLL